MVFVRTEAPARCPGSSRTFLAPSVPSHSVGKGWDFWEVYSFIASARRCKWNWQQPYFLEGWKYRKFTWAPARPQLQPPRPLPCWHSRRPSEEGVTVEIVSFMKTGMTDRGPQSWHSQSSCSWASALPVTGVPRFQWPSWATSRLAFCKGFCSRPEAPFFHLNNPAVSRRLGQNRQLIFNSASWVIFTQLNCKSSSVYI